MFTAGRQVATFTLIGHDDRENRERSIRIEIGGSHRTKTITDRKHGVKIGRNVAVVKVRAKDSKVSITTGNAVTEDEDASFTVPADPAPTANLDVTVLVTQKGDYGVSTGKQTVTIPTTGSATFTVSTTNDNVNETNGAVTVTVSARDGYAVPSQNWASTVSIIDNDVPAVSITAANSVHEGENGVFNITANPKPMDNLDVSLTVSENGYFGVTTGLRTVTITNTGSATLKIGAIKDRKPEPNGIITVTLNDGNGYKPARTQRGVAVSIVDAGYVAHHNVVTKVKTPAAQTWHGDTHVNRRQRVLVAFGELAAADVAGRAMTAAEAQEMANRYSSPVWDLVVTELTALAASS